MIRRLPLLLLTCLAAACAMTPREPAPVIAGDAPFRTRTGEASYHVLAAELALARSLPAMAAREYAEAARLSDDPQIAARAAEVSYEVGETDAALASATRWLELDPGSDDARRVLISLNVQLGDARAAYGHLKALLAGFDPVSDGFGALTGLLMFESNGRIAVESMRLLAADHANVAEAQFALAALALRANEADTGLAAARQAVALAPEWTQARMLLARALVTSGQTEEGIAEAAALVAAGADSALRLEYAILLIAVGRDEDARAELARVLEETPQSPGALRAAGLLELRQGNLELAEKHFTALLASGAQTLDAFYFLARLADQQGRQERALRLYMRVRAGDYAVVSQVRAAHLLVELGQPEVGLEHLEDFAAANPQHAVDLISAQGGLLVEMGKPEEALRLYDQALAERPENDTLTYARAFLYEDLDRIDEALVDLRAILRRNPDDATALNAVGFTLADHTTQYREAQRHVKRALELEPDNAAIIDSMGWVEYRLGNYDKALEYLQRAYALVQDSEIAAHLGEVLWVRGDSRGARDIWEEALVRDPESEALNEVVRRFAD